jgi:PEGA domain-containing protein
MALEDSASDSVVPATSVPPSSVVTTVRGHLSLTRLQGVAGTLAAIISIGGAFGYLVPFQTKSDRGEVLAIVQEARTGKPVADATVELLTLHDLLVTTVPPAAGAGTAKTPMKEGTYRLRVVHPKYTTESRQIYVLAGQTAQIQLRLSPRPAPPPPPVVMEKPEPPANSPYENIKKLFR